MDVDQVTRQTLNEAAPVYEALQAEQMAQGERSDNHNIAPLYKPLTISLKQQHGVGLGRVTSHVTLFDTGAFYRGLKFILSGDRFMITSTDDKTPMLLRKYGTKIFGLNEMFVGEYIREGVKPKWKNAWQSLTGLKLK